MTLKDLIASSSTLGELLKMMPGVAIDDDVLRAAIATKRDGQLLGDYLVETGQITPEQRARALELQSKIRGTRDMEEVIRFLDSVNNEAARARADFQRALSAAAPSR